MVEPRIVVRLVTFHANSDRTAEDLRRFVYKKGIVEWEKILDSVETEKWRLCSAFPYMPAVHHFRPDTGSRSGTNISYINSLFSTSTLIFQPDQEGKFILFWCNNQTGSDFFFFCGWRGQALHLPMCKIIFFRLCADVYAWCVGSYEHFKVVKFLLRGVCRMCFSAILKFQLLYTILIGVCTM